MTLLPKEEGFAYNGRKKYNLFKPEMMREVERDLSRTFFVHFYKSSFLKNDGDKEKKSLDFWRVDPETPIYRLLKENCPAVEEGVIRPLIGQTFRNFV